MVVTKVQRSATLIAFAPHEKPATPLALEMSFTYVLTSGVRSLARAPTESASVLTLDMSIAAWQLTISAMYGLWLSNSCVCSMNMRAHSLESMYGFSTSSWRVWSYG